MDARLIEMLKGAQGAMAREIESEGITTTTHAPAPTPVRHQPNAVNKTYFNSEETQLLESLPAGVQHNGQHVAQPMGQGGPDEYALRPVANTNPIQQTHQGVAANKLPPEILKAMIENPIVQNAPKINAAGMRTFDLSDVPSDMLRGAPQTQPQTVNETIQPQTQLTNQIGQKMLTMTEAELDNKIKSAILEFMTTKFTKTLTETTIKKTIGALIREGKIKVNTRKK